MLLSLIKELFKSRTQREQDALNYAQVLIDNSDLTVASKILDSLLEHSKDNARAYLMRGVVRRLSVQPALAIEDLKRAMALNANPGTCHFEMAACLRMQGDFSQALTHCEVARELLPESVPAFFLLTQLRLPGEYYFDVLRRIVDHIEPKTYVEIGVFEGASLQLVKTAQAIVGIDPDPKITWELEPNMKVFKSTSDDFFKNHDLRAELGNRQVDLAFIDGMHQFEFALRDFIHLERHCRPDSVILIHDCYPVDEESSGREPRDSRWSGDVWRLIVLLKKYRPDLSIHTIGTAPTGLAVIRNLNPDSQFLFDNHDRLVTEFLALEYSYLDHEKPAKLNLFPNNWDAITSIIGPGAK